MIDTKVAAALGFFFSPFALAATAAGDVLEFADFVFVTGAGTSRIWTSSSCALSTGTTSDALGDATMALAASAFLLSAFLANGVWVLGADADDAFFAGVALSLPAVIAANYSSRAIAAVMSSAASCALGSTPSVRANTNDCTVAGTFFFEKAFFM